MGEVKLLGIEASTEACSVAVCRGGEMWEQHIVAPREHTQRLLAMAQMLLGAAELGLADLDGIAFGRGPGAFTGVRIAASIVQGLAFGAQLPVIAVSSLAALAYGASDTQASCGVLAAIDARMGEIYWAGFERRGSELAAVIDERVGLARDVPLPHEGTWVGVGTGWGAYADALSVRCGPWLRRVDSAALPRASDVLRLAAPMLARGEALAPEMAIPVYLRDDVVQVSR